MKKTTTKRPSKKSHAAENGNGKPPSPTMYNNLYSCSYHALHTFKSILQLIMELILDFFVDLFIIVAVIIIINLLQGRWRRKNGEEGEIVEGSHHPRWDNRYRCM